MDTIYIFPIIQPSGLTKYVAKHKFMLFWLFPIWITIAPRSVRYGWKINTPTALQSAIDNLIASGYSECSILVMPKKESHEATVYKKLKAINNRNVRVLYRNRLICEGSIGFRRDCPDIFFQVVPEDKSKAIYTASLGRIKLLIDPNIIVLK